MVRRPPISTLTDTLFPSPPRFRSRYGVAKAPCLAALDPGYECRASEIDAASVFLPVTIARRVGAVTAADLRGGCRFRDRLFGLPGSGCLGRFAYHSGVSQLLQSNSRRSEEHTSELQSLMRNSYAVFCLKKKTTNT